MGKLVVLDINKNPKAEIPESFIEFIQKKTPPAIEVLHITENKNLIKILKDANWIIGYPFPYTFIKRNQILKGLLFLSAQIPSSFLKAEREYTIESIRGLNSDYVAHHGVFLLKKLVNDRRLNNRDLTVGLIGSGSIVKCIKPLLHGYVKNIITVSRREGSDFQFDDYHSFLSQSDIIFPLVSLNNETQSLFTKDNFFSVLRKPTSIINVARGELFQEDDILSFLSSSIKSFYYTDVVSPEPYPENGKLNNHPQIYRTNHVAGFGTDLWSRIKTKAAQTFDLWFKEDLK